MHLDAATRLWMEGDQAIGGVFLFFEICMTMATFPINVLSLFFFVLFLFIRTSVFFFLFYFLFHFLVNLHGNWR